MATGPVAFRVDTDIIGPDPRDRQEGRGAQQGLSMSCSYRLGHPGFVVVWRRLNYFELDIELLKQSVHTAHSEIELLSESAHGALAEIELFEFD